MGVFKKDGCTRALGEAGEDRCEHGTWLIVEMVWMEGGRGESKKKHQPNTHELR